MQRNLENFQPLYRIDAYESSVKECAYTKDISNLRKETKAFN